MGKTVAVIENEENRFSDFLKDYLSDTSSEIHTFHKTSEIKDHFDSLSPDLVFSEVNFLNLSFVQKLKVKKETQPQFRSFYLEASKDQKTEFPFEGMVSLSRGQEDFEKNLFSKLPLPETIKILVADDEPEIGYMVRDYFDGRVSPSYKVKDVQNGREAYDWIKGHNPDILILDIKMPIMDGRDLYLKLKKEGLQRHTIIFFDSISGEELTEIRKHGNPAVIEKGYEKSSLSDIMSLVKKLIYFGEPIAKM